MKVKAFGTAYIHDHALMLLLSCLNSEAKKKVVGRYLCWDLAQLAQLRPAVQDHIFGRLKTSCLCVIFEE